MGVIANVNCEAPRTLHTIGHSTRTLERLIEFLRLHEVVLLIDVRRWPASRRLPHFNRDALAAALKASDIDYLWRGDLGGFRKASADSPNTGWRVAAFRAYADFMLEEKFTRIMDDGCHEHQLTKFAEPQGTQIYYRGKTKDQTKTDPKLFD